MKTKTIIQDSKYKFNKNKFEVLPIGKHYNIKLKLENKTDFNNKLNFKYITNYNKRLVY